MNGLYGYPSSPTVTVARLGALAADDPVQAKATVMSFINGDYARQLQAVHQSLNEQYAQTDAIYAAIQRMPAGAQKDAAFKAQQAAVASINQQFVQYRTARDKYNDIATQISTYSLGTYTPALLSDFGQLETVMTVAVIVAIAYAISQLANMIGALRGQANASKGYIDQAAGLVHEMGGAIEQTGTAFAKTGSTLIWVALVGAALFVGYRVWKARGGSAPAAVSAPALAAGAGI